MKITVMIGPSGSGKSTKAREIARQTGALIVSRDDIRMSLFGYTPEDLSQYYTPPGIQHREKLVTDVHTAILDTLVNSGRSVIIDNTHLRMKYIRPYAKYGLPIHFHIMNTCMDECIARDASRPDQVGEQIIQRQFTEFENVVKTILDEVSKKDHLSVHYVGEDNQV